MSKYIIELNEDCKIVQQMCVTEHGNAYTNGCYSCDLEELNSDYINEHYGSLQDEAYQAGINDAWEATKRIFGYEIDGGIPINKVREVFGIAENAIFCTADIIRDYTAQQAIDKIKAYEGKHSDRIEVGDEVIYNGTTKCLVIVPETDKRYASLLDCKGIHYSADHHECKKTGKHYDIASILEAMRQ